jgi:ubiquinone/menaquinone biosynthesis C-methylase UbiE
LRLYVADATRIPEPDASFDAVFDFAIVHDVPRWEDAIAEVSRVLRPSGRFFFEEVTKHALDRWTYRRFFDHPKENRFGSGEFVAELERNGLRVQDRIIERFFGDFLLGVATKC